jgi:hypothetical protein
MAPDRPCRLQRQHYYLFDLCYVVNVLLLVHLWLLPRSIWLWCAPGSRASGAALQMQGGGPPLLKGRLQTPAALLHRMRLASALQRLPDWLPTL